MSWTNQLYNTYENHIGKKTQAEMQMAPIAHMYANAQLEVVLNQEGGFESASVLNKEVTQIPVTEESAGRANNIAPHALCDTLSYIAGDYIEHCENKADKEKAAKKFESYLGCLKKWSESEHTHPSVAVIYHYLEQKRLILDLVKYGIIDLKENGAFENKKIGGQPYEKVMVRFRILYRENIPLNAGMDETWEDSALIQAYTDYYLQGQKGRKDICYFSGEERTISENHPKGIVAANYGAKLVSANDDQGYTYRGRFQDAKQSFALSYEASQKIHNALTWLSRTQGVSIGTKDKRTFICWSPEGKKTPDIFDEMDLVDEEEALSTEEFYWKKLKKSLEGYQSQFESTDYVNILALDAATTGRLSITYYCEMFAKDFFGRLSHWGKTCKWFFLKFDEKKRPCFTIEQPSFRRIAECAYGREKGKFLEADDRVLKEQTQRLLKCMLEKQPIPFDLMQALVNRASVPMAYSAYNREMVLSTACAIINKYYLDKEKNTEVEGEQKSMELNLNNHDRSYLFGRLLAVCEKVERRTYERGETREPNAIRLQSAYVNHPMQTWKILEGLLNPYFAKLSVGERNHYKNIIGEIVCSLPEDDPQQLNQGLKETYLLGYYLQRAELNKKKEEQKEEKENE